MTLLTVQLVTLSAPSGDVKFVLQYDDQTMKATEVICTNGSTEVVTGTVTRNSDGRVYSRQFGPGTTVLPLPVSGANSITVVLNSRGRLDGYDFAVG